MDVLVDLDNLWHHLFNFDKFGYLNQFLFDSLHFINLWQCDGFFNNFLYYPLNGYYIIYVLLYCHNFLDDSGHFFDHLLNIRYNFFDLLNLLFNQDFLNIFLDLPEFDNLLDHRHYFFNDLWSGDDPLSDFLFRNNLLDHSLDWHWDFKGHNNLPFNLNSLDALISQRHYFLNLYLDRHLLNYSDWDFFHDLLRNHLFFIAGHLYWLFDNRLEWLLYFDVDILNCFDFFNHLLDYRHLNNFFNLYDLLSDDLLLDDLFDQLRHLHYLFNNSWDHYYFLNYFLNFDHFGYFYHFLDDLFDFDWDFLNPVDDGGDFDDFLFDVLDGFGYFDIDIDELFNF